LTLPTGTNWNERGFDLTFSTGDGIMGWPDGLVVSWKHPGNTSTMSSEQLEELAEGVYNLFLPYSQTDYGDGWTGQLNPQYIVQDHPANFQGEVDLSD
jgi:hypothetical protein